MVHILGLGVWVLMLSTRYESKKWVPRDGKLKSPPRVTGQKTSVYGARPEIRSQHGNVKDIERSYEEQKGARPPGRINSTPQQVHIIVHLPFSRLRTDYSQCFLFYYVFIYGLDG